MSKINTEVLGCFWLPPQYYNDCISGANANTIKKRGNSVATDYYSQEYFEKVTLPSLRQNITPYPSSKKYLEKSSKYCLGFRDVVNDALRAIYKGMKGYVFTIEQLTEVIKFVPDVKVVLDDDIYYVSKGK